MRYTITGRNIDLTEGLKNAVKNKLSKLEKYFSADTELIVALSVQKDLQKIEVTVPVRGSVIRAEESTSDMYASIDLVEETLERQLRRYRKKLIDRQQSRPAFSELFAEEQEEEDPEESLQIVKRKRFDLKPMYPEDACLEMELLGHSFYMFLNAETEKISVVYRRKGNSYGMIEPEN